MAATRSDSTPYESRFGGGWITANQYLAESMCDRLARSKGKSLPTKFWETDEWKRAFLLQVRHVSGLLRLYSVDAIIGALKSPQGKRVYSFGARWLDALVQEQQRRLRLQEEQRTFDSQEKDAQPEIKVGVKGPRPQFKGNRTSLDKLRALDGEEEDVGRD